jgi:hypothetical protein
MLDGHENSSKENSNREPGQEPGCMNTIEYANSESGSLFFYNLVNVERQLCIVDRGYAIVTKQQ